MQIERQDSAPAHMAGYASATDYGISWTQRQAEADFETYESFKDLCAANNATALVDWAPLRNDYSAPSVDGVRPQRKNFLHEVMSESLDYASGPSMADAMQLILNATNSSDAAIAKQARALIHEMAKTWAKFNTPEVA